MLLSTHQDAFHKLSEAAKRLQAELLNEGAFQVNIPCSDCLSAQRSQGWEEWRPCCQGDASRRHSLWCYLAPAGLQDICDAMTEGCLHLSFCCYG